jgi:ferredoxin
MAKKSELIKISPTEYSCSSCAFKIEKNTARPQPATEAEWKRIRDQQFAEHIRLCHSAEEANSATKSPKPKTREDVNQAAARIIREATKD